MYRALLNIQGLLLIILDDIMKFKVAQTCKGQKEGYMKINRVKTDEGKDEED